MIIVSYDFSNNKTRTKLAKFLKKYGDRTQYSVFTVRNSPRVLRNITSEIEMKYKNTKKTDSILVFQLCEACERKIMRYGNSRHDVEDVVYFA